MKDKLTASLLILTLIISTLFIIKPIMLTKANSEIGDKNATNKSTDFLTPSQADPKIIYVDDDNVLGPWNGSKEYPYQNITSGLEHAETYDTIFVFNGTYQENLEINETISLVGENKSNTIIDGMGITTVVKATSDNVKIINFTIQNAPTDRSSVLLYSSYNDVYDNIIINSSRGVELSNSYRNEIVGNTIRNNTNGIYLVDSNNNNFTHNTAENNTCGIYLLDSSNNNIYNNKFVNNTCQTCVRGKSNNKWNATYPIGGNFWSNYTGVDEKSGPNQDQPGSDGIGDIPHNITKTEMDWLPRLPTVRNVDTGLDYFWIQDAIDAVETKDGHTIKVYASVYLEYVQVHKSLILLPGGNQTTATVRALVSGSGKVLHITTSNVRVSNFTIQNGEYGIHLDKSGNTILRNCSITNNRYNFFVTGTSLSHFINNIDDSNMVDGKHIYYLINNRSLVINSSAYPELGYLGLVNCTDISVHDLTLTGNGQGLLLAFTNSSTIMHVNASNNLCGIYLYGCSGNTVNGSDVKNNEVEGVSLHGSLGNNVTSNNISGSDIGVELKNSNNCNIAGNNIKECTSGIDIWSNSTKIEGNIVVNNWYGIISNYGFDNYLTANNVTDNNRGIWLEDSFNNTLIGNDIASNKERGIFLRDSFNNKIPNNYIARNPEGIYLHESKANTIIENNITENVNNGIYLFDGSSGNIIFHNSFINNKKQHAGIWTGVKNTWDNGYPSGGNYWSNCTILDEKRGPNQDHTPQDGINDTKYTKLGLDNQDRYPLTKPYGGQHDIGIEYVYLSKTVFNYSTTPAIKPYIPPYNLNITVKVINYGTVVGTSETFEINVTIVGTSLSNQTTETVTFRNSTTVTFPWPNISLAKGTYPVIVNITHVSNETYIEDNTSITDFKISILGDINGDFKVDIVDLVLVIKAFNKYRCHPYWHANPLVRNADLNHDNLVDIVDLVLICRKDIFGKSDP